MNIVNVGYDSTHYYVLISTNTRLLIDIGWPGTRPKLVANLRRKDIAFADIDYLLVTHYHPDHAGPRSQGARCTVDCAGAADARHCTDQNVYEAQPSVCGYHPTRQCIVDL